MSERLKSTLESMFDSRGKPQGEYADYLYHSKNESGKSAKTETNQAILDVAIEKGQLSSRYENEGLIIDIIGLEEDKYDNYYPQLLSFCVSRELLGGDHICHYYSMHQMDENISLLSHVGGSFNAMQQDSEISPSLDQSNEIDDVSSLENIFWFSGPRTFVSEPEAVYLLQMLQESQPLPSA